MKLHNSRVILSLPNKGDGGMSLFSKLFGDGSKTPENLTSIEQVAAAIDAAERERRNAADARRELIQKRHEALAGDETDAAIKKIDAAIDALALTEDRLDALAPRLHKRLSELQSDARRETLATLRQEYEAAVKTLDSALAAVLAPLDRFTMIVEQIDAAGFSAEARGFVVPPPLMAGGIVTSRELLERWRQQREFLADAAAAASKPYVPAPPPPTRVVPIKRMIDTSTAVNASPMYRKVVPTKLSMPVPAGFRRLESIMNGVDYNGRQLVIGDQIDVHVTEADRLLTGRAFRHIANEEVTNEAAQ